MQVRRRVCERVGRVSNKAVHMGNCMRVKHATLPTSSLLMCCGTDLGGGGRWWFVQSRLQLSREHCRQSVASTCSRQTSDIVEPAACFCCVVACRFADCMHLAEPGCAVTAAELERHEHYIKFLAEVKVRFMSTGDGVAWLVWHGKGWPCGWTAGSCLSAVHETLWLGRAQGRV